MTYQGGCHCGRIAFEVEGQIEQLADCNCSICSKKGVLMWFIQRDQLRLKTPESDMGTYRFNTHKINHHFCANCGIAPLSTGKDQSGAEMAVVNVRYLEGVDTSGFPVMHFDGRSV